MRLLESNREYELLDNAKNSLADCFARVKAGEYQESLRILLTGIDVLANLKARVTGEVTTEMQAERRNHDRFIRFLREEIPQSTEHEMQWEGKTIRLDLSEMSYSIRCKQVHEYSNLSSMDFPIRLQWEHRHFRDPAMWICGSPNSKRVEYVALNGLFLLQTLVSVAEKYIAIFSSTPTRVDVRTNPFAIYELLGTVKRKRCDAR